MTLREVSAATFLPISRHLLPFGLLRSRTANVDPRCIREDDHGERPRHNLPKKIAAYVARVIIPCQKVVTAIP